MTIEEKARAYDKALEKLKPLYEQAKKDDNPIWSTYEYLIPGLAESEDERARKEAISIVQSYMNICDEEGDPCLSGYKVLAYLEKQKENSKTADSIPSKCEDRWHKVKDSLPNNTREVLCKDAIGNYFIGRYYSKGIWEVSMYDDSDKSNEDNPSVVMWIDIPSEKQKEQKPTLNWRTIEQATTKRTDEGDCVTTEKMLIKGLIDDEDYRIIDKDVMVNKNLLCIPVSELNAEEQKSCDNLDSEIKRFFDECIVVHEAEIYGWKEDVIEVENYELTARHFAEWGEKQKKQNDEDKEYTDFTIYHPIKNGKGEYECIPYSFYGSLTSFSEDKDLIDFLRTCFYTEEECNEWIERQKEQKLLTIESAYEKFVNPETLKEARINKYIRAQLLWELMHNGIITEVDYQYLTDDKHKPWTVEEYLIAYQKGFEMSEQLKQKEQKPVEPSDDELQRYQNELYDFKVFAAKQAREHHISFVHDFEWNNFCAELLSYFNEKQKPFNICEQCPYYKDCPDYNEQKHVEESGTAEPDYGICDDYIPASLLHALKRHGWYATHVGEKPDKEVIKYVAKTMEQKPSEWSEEDEIHKLHTIQLIEEIKEWGEKDGLHHFLIARSMESITWLKSLPERFNLEPKEEWSEEDEKMRNALWNLLKILYAQDYSPTAVGIEAGKFRNWLKSLRPPFKDKEMKLKILKYLSTRCSSLEFEEVEDYLNNLRPSWKPSEEQMRCLESLPELLRNFKLDTTAQMIEEIHDKLKKL